MRFIIGCDFHPSYQQVAMLDRESGDLQEKELSDGSLEEVRKFYGGLPGAAEVGIEASGQSQWFEKMLRELGHQVRMGDATQIRKRKTGGRSTIGEMHD